MISNAWLAPRARWILALFITIMLLGSAFSLAGIFSSDHAEAITFAGSYNTPGNAIAVALLRNYAFVADGSQGLQAIDVSDPSNPAPLDQFPTVGMSVSDVALYGEYYALLSVDGGGLQIVDISTPNNMVAAGAVETLGDGQAVASSGTYAYIADGSQGLQIIDIADTGNPAIAGSFPIAIASDITISGNYAYVVDWNTGLKILDISDPASPSQAGTYNVVTRPAGIAVSGKYAYIADGNSGGMKIVDISNPASPIHMGAIWLPGAVTDIALDGNIAYLSGWDGLQAVDVSNPSQPKAVAREKTFSMAALSVAVSGGFAFVADSQAGLLAMDISDVTNPSSPTLAAGLDTPGAAMDLQIEGDYAFIADAGSGLQIADVSDPANPSPASALNTPGAAEGVAVIGGFAYIADGYSGVQVIDATNKQSPVQKDSLITSDYAQGIDASGTHVYVATLSTGLQVIDVADPDNISLTDSLDTQWAMDVEISGDYAYVSDNAAGMRIIDISDPGDISLVSTLPTNDRARAIAVTGGLAYVADESAGLTIVDVSNPAAPFEVGNIDTAGTAIGVTLAGIYAYVADAEYGVHKIDVSDSLAPVQAGTFDTNGTARSSAIEGGHAFVADTNSGLQVLDLKRNYFWTWYDDSGGDNWLLMANPANEAGTMPFDLTIEGASKDLTQFAGGEAEPGETITSRFPNTVGGPVVASSQTGRKAIMSQRILWPKGGSSLEEVLATDAGKLSYHFYWTWYDQLSGGYQNWIMLSNPNPYPVNYEITIGGNLPDRPGAEGLIPAGDNVNVQFDGMRDGPVEVRACRLTFGSGHSCAYPGNIFASQRVLSNGGLAFNEEPGIPAGELSSRYSWNWYDQATPGAQNWIMIANPPNGPAKLYYTVKKGSYPLPIGMGGPIAPGRYEAVQFPGTIGGPIDVSTYSDLNHQSPANAIVSQRSIFGPSFEETPGYPTSSLGSDYHWTWYDMLSPGASNWIMIANQIDPAGPIYYQIFIGDGVMPHDSGGPIAAGASIEKIYPGLMRGPVRVKTFYDADMTQWAPSIVSQRVLWNGYFNEVMGTVLD